MSRELILIPKTKYELLHKPIQTVQSRIDNDQPVTCQDDEKVVNTPVADPSIDLVMDKTLTYVVPKNGQRRVMGLWYYIKDRR